MMFRLTENERAPSRREHDVQAEIVDALTLAGFRVLHTTAFRQRGPSGVAKGVPDLLCFHRDVRSCALPIEVKRPGRPVWSNDVQKELHESRMVALAQSAEDALLHGAEWLAQHCVEDPGVSERAVHRVRTVLKAMAVGR